MRRSSDDERKARLEEAGWTVYETPGLAREFVTMSANPDANRRLMEILQDKWQHGTHADRTQIVRNCYDMVRINGQWRKPEAVADMSFAELSYVLRLDLCSQFA